MSRRSLIVLLLVGLFLTVSAVAAQNPGALSVRCTQVGVRTGNEILVDVEGATGRDDVAVSCTVNVLNGNPVDDGDNREVGTPRTGYRVPLSRDQYPTVYDSIDVFVVKGDGASIYGWFVKPVRVCFGVDAADAAAMNPADPFDEANPLYVVFSDARYFQDAKGTGSNQPARNVTVLNVVPEGLELSYVCADIDNPGSVSLVDNLNPGVKLAVQPSADRCLYAGDRKSVV